MKKARCSCFGPFCLIVVGLTPSQPTGSELGGVLGELGYVLLQSTGLEQLFLIIVHLSSPFSLVTHQVYASCVKIL